MPRYDLPNAAPEPLRLVQLFVNSVDREHGMELFGSATELRAWLRERGLDAHGVGADTVARALELREALRALLRANGGAPRDAAAAAALNRAEARLRLAADGSVEVVAPGPLGPVVAVAFRSMLDGSWRRLKSCRTCGWAFYDLSRNRSGSWCSMQICGNRRKTRAYRSRRRAR